MFGRGTIEFLLPKNRKVLVYIRSYQDDIVLCIANLSRFVQPIELDLSRYEGLTPIEMFGRTEFPRIERHPYFVTIAPHSFYWFQLQRVPETITIRVVPTLEETQDLPLVEIAGTWQTFQSKPVPQDMKTKVLENFILRQRWFAAKASRVKDVKVLDRVFLDTARPVAYVGLAQVETEEGEKQLYSVPLAIKLRTREPNLERTLARIKSVTDEALLVDALYDNAVCHAILQGIGENIQVKGTSGTLTTRSTPLFQDRIKGLKMPLKITRIDGEQSNTSVIFGDQMILKFFRRLQPGPNPDYEILRFLNENTTFDRIPTFLGAIEYTKSDSEPLTLGLLETLIPNQGNAWNH
ncbi:MAG: alpha-glucosidase C-terminal domain-containing protein, partial [Acidobacteriota bacterium]